MSTAPAMSTSDLSSIFDILLACCLPLAIFLIAFRRSSGTAIWTWNELRDFFSLQLTKDTVHGPFSLQNAHKSYARYVFRAHDEFANRRASYNSLGRAHKRLGNRIGYARKLDLLEEANRLNGVVTSRIAELASEEFGIREAYSGVGDTWKVREALKHFVRDWSAEGAAERERIFSPILEVLKEVDPSERGLKQVLVPGSGLGRLAWEISLLGYNTSANELSFFMNLAFRYLLSPKTTTFVNQHTVQPYSHWFSHQRSNEANFRAVSFPDVIPRLSSTFRVLELDFLTLSPPSQANTNKPQTHLWTRSELSYQIGYDYIVTLFFIDTSLNVFATMEKIYSLLRPGGTWINLGPLLWTSGAQAKLELSLEEVLEAAQQIGFIFHPRDEKDGRKATESIDCEYTADSSAMMRWTYRAEFWVAVKSK